MKMLNTRFRHPEPCEGPKPDRRAVSSLTPRTSQCDRGASKLAAHSRKLSLGSFARLRMTLWELGRKILMPSGANLGGLGQ
jgi:hypothetical protein